MNNNSIVTVNDEITKNTLDEKNPNNSAEFIIQELLKFDNQRLNKVIVSAVIIKLMDNEKKKMDKKVEYLSKFMSAVIENILEIDDPQGILIEFLRKHIKFPPELEEKMIEIKRDDKVIIRKFNGCTVLDFSKERKRNEVTKCFLPLPNLFKTDPKGFIEILLTVFLNSTSLSRNNSNFKKLAELRSIEICESKVFDKIASYVYYSTFPSYAMLLFYYMIYFSLFVLVVHTGNRILMIASLIVGSLIILYSTLLQMLELFMLVLSGKKRILHTVSTLLVAAVIFPATFLPYVTLILELHNNSDFPRLQSLSILFMWFFNVSQLRFIEGIGIFLAIFVLFSYSHALLVLLSKIPPDNDNIPNTFTGLDESLKNVWMMLLGDYDSLAPWTNNSFLDIIRIVFSFTTTIIILNILIALMNDTYEETSKHARAMWIAHVAEFASIMMPFSECFESSKSRYFKLRAIKDVSYIVYDVPTRYFNEQEQTVLAKELCEMSNISDYDPKKFEEMSKTLIV
ncbi:14575_t:CDS:2 [Dentiscutata erythropus]|uniref:14575_t:CDS:1 n=1 Tax=Dentiscutata erythropus TaxID=1348616 RepID=A0A9N9AFN0_9GLOM|nr:14575_t:CDS:2 [Dentiscutata erythropus]